MATQILNNIRYGVNSSFATTYLELNLISCSLDYNGQNAAGGQVIIANGSLDLFGGHMENRQTPFIQVPPVRAAS